MKRSLFSIGLSLMTGLILLSCEFESLDQDDDLLNAKEELLKDAQNQGLFDLQELGLNSSMKLDPQLEELIKDKRTVRIGNYDVTFLDMVENPDNTTTFFYNVKGTGVPPSLDSFFLQIPDCTVNPVSRTPSNASTIEGGYIKWNSSIPQNSEANYSVTYPGLVGLGFIEAIVVTGNITSKGEVLGPCKGIYKIQGSIYIDSNGDDIKQASEAGLGGFDIELKDNIRNAVIATTKTDALGLFSFYVFEGNYSVAVIENLVTSNYLPNGGRISENIGLVNEDKTGFDFGYTVDAPAMILRIESGIYNLDTKDAKFWTQELRAQGKGKSVYSRNQLLGFLVQIEGIYLPEPFQFGSDKFATALDIITRPIKSDIDLFLQQLLTAELNIVSGRGAKKADGTNDDEFNTALIRLTEPLACAALGTCPTSAPGSRVKTYDYINAFTVSDGTDVLSSFNGSGGIKK
jgi:hypothetical protein